MKKILVICGTGIATSTVVANKLRDFLKEKGMESGVEISHASITDKFSSLDAYDVILTTTTVPDSIKDKVISAVPILTGAGEEEVYEEVVEKLKTA